ncbi:hypothetical protein [Piscirickettsia litoralis]|uniref:Plasmid replication protein RepL domain-containing protein n=1 Tax=Piscirickettsia litoralis TaxID=1891921 RepID=A0ABX2ZXZ0_9GAMM|nr:hypothetical protein [Piscirickettsia litoralis]ODN41353.1 hypothetical protein BGC07_16410 [Piscirickettsia litoralis]
MSNKTIKSDIQEHFEDGVLVQRTEVSHTVNSGEPSYVKLYFDDLAFLFGMPKGLSDVLFELIKLIDFETNEIHLTTPRKEQIVKTLGIKRVQTLNNYIATLKKKQILLSAGRGVYKPNPYIIARGKWSDIKKLRNRADISLKIDYTEKGRKISTDIREKPAKKPKLKVVKNN